MPDVCLRLIWGREVGRGIYQQNCYCPFREQRPGHWFACAEKCTVAGGDVPAASLIKAKSCQWRPLAAGHVFSQHYGNLLFYWECTSVWLNYGPVKMLSRSLLAAAHLHRVCFQTAALCWGPFMCKVPVKQQTEPWSLSGEQSRLLHTGAQASEQRRAARLVLTQHE